MTEQSIPHLTLDRNGGLPIYEQLRAGIEMAIITGDLPDGAPLPAVRQLAAAQGVSPNTVVRAYRDLEAEGVIRAVPKRGFFVVSSNEPVQHPELVSVQSLIDEALDSVTAAGVDPAEFLQFVSERINHRKSARRLVAVAGYQDAVLAERVAVVAQGVADLAVDVIGLSYEELAQLSTAEQDQKLSKVEWILVSVLETRYAGELLGPYARRILPITRKVRDDVRAFIAEQPSQTRFGIIAGTDELISRTVASVSRLHPLTVLPMSASVEDHEAVERVIQHADVLVIGSLARPYLANRALPVPSIELAHVPDEAALRRLRARLNGTSG